MAGMTHYLENKIIDQALRNTPYTAPGTVYVALLTSDPGDDGEMSSELSGNGYQRKAVVFDAPDGGQTKNSQDIVFDQATADWNNVSHIAIMDAVAGGNALFTGQLTSTINVTSGDSLRIDIGNLQITID